MTRYPLKEAELRKLAPKAQRVMGKILDMADATDDPKLCAKLFEAVAPYLLRRQPQAIEHRGDQDKPIRFEWVVANAGQQRSTQDKEGA